MSVMEKVIAIDPGQSYDFHPVIWLLCQPSTYSKQGIKRGQASVLCILVHDYRLSAVTYVTHYAVITIESRFHITLNIQ